MMKGVFIVVGAIVAGFMAYCIYFVCATQTTHTMLATPEGEIEWLRREFQIDDEQLAKIRTMREEYEPECALMCRRIAEANSTLDAVVAKHSSVTPEIVAALQHVSAVEAECRQKMLAHVYSVSAEMSADNRLRYLALMKPGLIQAGLPSSVAVSPTSPTPREAP